MSSNTSLPALRASAGRHQKEWDPRPAPASLPPRAHSALSSYDALRDGNLRFDMRPGATSAGRAPAIPKEASITAFQRLIERQSTPGPKAAPADQRLHAQVMRYEALARTPDPAAAAGPPPIPIVPKADPAAQVRPEEVFIKARDRLLILWDTLAIDDGVRAHFVATAFREVTAESVAAMHAEIERLVQLRAREAEVKRAVEIREGLLYVLQDHTERAVAAAAERGAPEEEDQQPVLSGSGQDRRRSVGAPLSFTPLDPAAARDVRQVVTRLRKATFAVLDAVAAWRRALGYDAAYRWRGTSYLLKMQTDLAFVASVPAVAHAIGTTTVGNPLLDPSYNRPPNAGGNGVAAGANPTAGLRRADTMRMPVAVLAGSVSGNGGGAGFSAERYAEARAVLHAEPEVWHAARKAARTYRFDAGDIGDVDADVVDSAIEECMFVPPEDFQGGPGGRGRAVREMQEHMAVVARVVRIQRAVRRMLAGRHAAIVARRHNAARRIQAIARRIVATNAAERRRREVRGAVAIQAAIRGCLTRMRMSARPKLTDTAAALRIQCAYRRHAAQETVALHRALFRAAARIQALFRGFKGRQAARARESEVMAGAASSVQRVWRGAALRKSGRGNPRVLAAVARIQRWFRGWRDRRYADMLRGLQRAAIVIQRATRRRLLRTM